MPEIVGLPAIPARSRSVEDLFEYGSRAGFWRVLRLFEERRLHFTSWAIGLALQRNPDAGRAMAEAGHEVASHGWRWIDYRGMPEAQEREHIRRTVATIRDLCGAPPLGWYTGRYSDNTRRLVMEETETLYDSDAYNDDLPYWVTVAGKPRLIVPYALDTNDFKFALTPGLDVGRGFLHLSARRLRPAVPRGRAASRRCCRSGCTAAWSAAPGAPTRWRASWTMCSGTTAPGSAGGWRSRGTGWRSTRLPHDAAP